VYYQSGESDATPPQGSIDNNIESADYSGIVLQQNAPNPFGNITTINYELSRDLNGAKLVIYDLNGRTIANYNVVGTGSVEFDSTGLNSGTYAYAIVVDGQSIATNKMVIAK